MRKKAANNKNLTVNQSEVVVGLCFIDSTSIICNAAFRKLFEEKKQYLEMDF